MALDGIAGKVFREAAIPGLTDVSSTPAPTSGSGDNKQFPSLTPAQSAANLKAAGATAAASSNGNPITGAAGGALGKTEFLQLLVQEMTNQDPLKPADNTQFIAQLAQFSTLEQMQNMNDGFKNLSTTFQTAQARGLLNVDIKAVNSNTGATVTGTVDQIIMNTDGSVQVDVNGTAVNHSDIVSIGAGAPTTTSPTSGTAPQSLPGTVVPPSGTSGTTSTGTSTTGA